MFTVTSGDRLATLSRIDNERARLSYVNGPSRYGAAGRLDPDLTADRGLEITPARYDRVWVAPEIVKSLEEGLGKLPAIDRFAARS